MATFNLQKGGKFAINKGIQRIRIGLGWDVANKPGETFDLDASVFGLVHINGQPKFYGDGSHALTYANQDLRKDPKDKSLHTADEMMVHTGDNRTGTGQGDDEQIVIALAQLPADLVEVSVFITIYEAVTRKQDFGRVSTAYVRVSDEDTQQELCRYDLSHEFGGKTAVQVGSFVREGNQWVFKAIGAGSTADLGAILEKYS
jgi:tellurium resistance protein TerD